MIEPERLQRRPHLGRLPIPYVTHIDPASGRPDFRVHDDMQRMRIGMRGLCQLCGEALDFEIVFVGYPSSAETRIFGEPPGHRDCLDFAWEICPWLAGRGWDEEWRRAARDVEVLPRDAEEPQEMVWYVCEDFQTVPDDERSDTGVKYLAGPPLQITTRTRG